jgi:hypothetical protein
VFSLWRSSVLAAALGAAVLFVAVPWARPAAAQVPRQLHYQATLADGAFPVDDTLAVEVAFFADPTGGTPLAGWSETYPALAVTDGRLDLLLGAQTPLPDALLDAASVYLQLTVDGEPFPRLPVASTLFALRAGTAERVGPGGVAPAALQAGAVTAPALADAAVTPAALAPDAVRTAALDDEAVTRAKLAPGAVGTSQLAGGAVTSAKLGPSAVTGGALADGAVTTAALANGAVTAQKVNTGELVTTLNGLTDAVRLVGGNNVTITPSAGAGTITIDAGVQRSSRRWKTDVATLTDGLALVEQLRGVRYRWKESGAPDIGFIAEEVGGVVPEVVAYADNGVDATGVDYARLVALLVEAVKAQQAQIEADRALLHDLRARLAALEGRRAAPEVAPRPISP